MESFMLKKIKIEKSVAHQRKSTYKLNAVVFFGNDRFTFQVNKHLNLVSSHLIEYHDRSHPLARHRTRTRSILSSFVYSLFCLV